MLRNIAELSMKMKNEPPQVKSNNQHRRKQKAQISFAVTAKLFNAFVFATRIVHFLYFLNPKFPASNHLRLVSVRPGRKPNCCFSHAQAQIEMEIISVFS